MGLQIEIFCIVAAIIVAVARLLIANEKQKEAEQNEQQPLNLIEYAKAKEKRNVQKQNKQHNEDR